jgi:hypothetical protein
MNLVTAGTIAHHYNHQIVTLYQEQIEGCVIFGVLQVQKVPAKLVISLASETHSFDHEMINTTHHINHLIFGSSVMSARPSMLRQVAMMLVGKERVEYLRTTEDIYFPSMDVNTTHEHYIEMVATKYTDESFYKKAITKMSKKVGQALTQMEELVLYKYTMNSGSFVESPDHRPAIRLNYDISPLVVEMKKGGKSIIDFLVSVCAIVGGVFTVLGLVDGILIGTYNAVLKKLD